jgi:hypothetical protein
VADDEAVALYGTVKRMVQAMAEREAALEAKTAALDAAIASLQQLPATLGKQTSQYIEKGVRASIKEDLKWPIEDALKGPIGELHYATTQARDVMREVRSESKLQSWTTVAIMVVLGTALGMGGSYFFFIRDLGNINDRLETIQQQIAAPAPAPDTAKPAGKPGKAHQSH